MSRLGKAAIGGAAALAVAACAAIGVGVASGSNATTAAPAARDASPLTLYSVATAEQFVNNSDDRQRGKGNNPFGNFHDATATTRERGNGPFPGDVALFKFDIFQSGDLKTKAGTATFTCQYNFNKNAFCDATYQLKGGTFVGAGAFNFNAPSFALAITGGTGKFRGMRGDVEASPAKGPRHAQRLVFTVS